MTRAEIQALIDARGEITLPHAIHWLDGPLVIRSGAHLNLAGGYLVNAFDAGGPILVTPTEGVATQWSVRNGNLVDGGIALRRAAQAPNFFRLDGLYVKSEDHLVACAFDARDCGGAWMGTLARVHALGCVDGFRQTDGTTMLFDNCFASECRGKAWDLENVYGLVLRACAADKNRGQAVRFYACDAFSIASWYMEGNRVAGCTFMLFDNCRGDIAGMVSLGSVLSAETGQGAYLVQINGGRLAARGLTLGGAPKRNPDTASGAGLSTVLLVTGGAAVELSGSEVYRADTAHGAGQASAVGGDPYPLWNLAATVIGQAA